MCKLLVLFNYIQIGRKLGVSIGIKVNVQKQMTFSIYQQQIINTKIQNRVKFIMN